MLVPEPTGAGHDRRRGEGTAHVRAERKGVWNLKRAKGESMPREIEP